MPTNKPLETYILAIRNSAEAYASSTWAGFKGVSEAQVDRIRIAMDHGAMPIEERMPHDLRVLILRAIFGESQLMDLRINTPFQIDSTKDLSCAQGMAMIDALFGHPEQGLRYDTPMTPEGKWLIRELAAAIRAERLAVTNAFVDTLVETVKVMVQENHGTGVGVSLGSRQ